MSLDEFSMGLCGEMESLVENENTFESARDTYAKLLLIVYKLKDYVSRYHFESKEEEIHYFKEIKPKFYSKLYYYQKIFEILSGEPAGVDTDNIEYYLKELDAVKNYIENNKDFLSYYRSGSNLFDKIYFVRKEPDLWLSLDTDGEPDNTIVYDHKLSKLLAYEMVAEFIIEKLQSLTDNYTHNITWTAPKAALIELLYAIQACGACNNGKVEIKQLANHFEYFFNVKLGNFYRTFQEIRIRKIRTTFIDQMKVGLIKRMDSSDENPRFTSV